MATTKTERRNYIAYKTSLSPLSRIGHLDVESETVTPLSYASGTPLTSLYEVIEAGESGVTASDAEVIALSSLTLLPPISGRDVLAVGKNYLAHAAEFNKSGYDSSDKVDLPSHPVIFTKRASSIVAAGTPIHPHPSFADTLDYEGEIGVIFSKAGYQISEKDAWSHVWGYTIINDVTSRNEQRDHKQFYIGKSADSYCPMGPIAVPKEHLPSVLEVTTSINNEVRQKGTTEDLIFSIPKLIATLSAGHTIQSGDVIATGTPAGVGFGFTPPKWLKPKDTISITVTGLGTLTNTVDSPNEVNATPSAIKNTTHILTSNTSCPATSLTIFPGKKALFYKTTGNPSGTPVICIHGLGGSHAYFQPLHPLLTSSHHIHLFDLEGHGLSPTSASSTLSIASFARDVEAVIAHAGLKSGFTLIAHSMGCLVALKFALSNPGSVGTMILMGPPPTPLPEAAAMNNKARARLVREKGMPAVVDAVVAAGTSQKTQAENHLALAAVKLSLLGTDGEGYTKACTALAGSKDEALEVEKLEGVRTLILTGDEDKVGSEAVCTGYEEKIGAEVKTLQGVGHWHLFEDGEGCGREIGSFLGVKAKAPVKG